MCVFLENEEINSSVPEAEVAQGDNIRVQAIADNKNKS